LIQRALKEFVGSLDPTYAKESKDFYVGFEGSFGARHVTARTLTSRHINNLVCIEGALENILLFFAERSSTLERTC
jgi:DNA replication licensing factor MCM3